MCPRRSSHVTTAMAARIYLFAALVIASATAGHVPARSDGNGHAIFAGEAPAAGTRVATLPDRHLTPCPSPWQATTLPIPGRFTAQSHFSAVAAISATDVWVAGVAGGYQDRTRALIVHWDGRSWQGVPTPYIAVSPSGLNAIAALSWHDVWAVGYSGSGPLALRWDGTHWRIVAIPLPAPGRGGTLDAISAVSHTDIWLLSHGASTLSPRLEHWNGVNWSVIDAPRLGADHTSNVSAIAAIAANDVWAVGYWTSHLESGVLLGHWNGRSWRLLPSPIHGPADTMLNVSAISARSSDDAWVVGAPTGGSTGPSLLLHWDGVRWRVVSGPDIGVLTAVAALSDHDVWIESADVAAHWDGEHWRIIPRPAGALTALSASSPHNVWAIGYLTVNPVDQASVPLVERYAGAMCYATDPVVRAITLPGRVGGSLVVDQTSGHAFAGGGNGALDVIDLASGSVVHEIPAAGFSDYLGTPQALAVAGQARRIFVTDLGWTFGSGSTGHGAIAGMVRIRDTATGALLRTVLTGDHPVMVAVDSQAGHAFVVNFGDTDSVGPNRHNRNGSVAMLDVASGTILATTAIGKYPVALAVDTHAGRVFVLDQADGTVSVLDARTGALRHTFAVSSLGTLLDFWNGHIARMALDEHSGRLFVGGYDGHIDVLDARDGRLLHTLNLGATPATVLRDLAVDQVTGRVYAAWSRVVAGSYPYLVYAGRLSMLDGLNGALIKTVAIPGDVVAVGVDEADGLVDVTNGNFGVHSSLYSGGVTLLDARGAQALADLPATIGPIAFDYKRGHLFVGVSGAMVILDALAGARPSSWQLRQAPSLPPRAVA